LDSNRGQVDAYISELALGASDDPPIGIQILKEVLGNPGWRRLVGSLAAFTAASHDDLVTEDALHLATLTADALRLGTYMQEALQLVEPFVQSLLPWAIEHDPAWKTVPADLIETNLAIDWWFTIAESDTFKTWCRTEAASRLIDNLRNDIAELNGDIEADLDSDRLSKINGHLGPRPGSSHTQGGLLASLILMRIASVGIGLTVVAAALVVLEALEGLEPSSKPEPSEESVSAPQELAPFEPENFQLAEVLSERQRSFSYAAFEPFYGAVVGMLHSGHLDDYDQTRGEERYDKTMKEWDSADGAQPVIINANHAVLKQILDAYEASKPPFERSTALDHHLARAAELAEQLAGTDEGRAQEIGAEIAEELAQAMPADEHEPRRRVAEMAGWIAAAKAAGVGIASGATVGGFVAVLATGLGASSYATAMVSLAFGSLTMFVVYGFKYLTGDE
jgi:hypothetical protein